MKRLLIGFLLWLESEAKNNQDCSAEKCSFQGRLRLLLVGDTGGLPVLQTTSVQVAVAASLARRASSASAVLNVGDNFYFTGVENVEDSLFKTRFEEVYEKDGLPWYMIAGNHDHFGNISAQILYTNYSDKWFFPSLYYSLCYGSSLFSVDILMIDTIQLCGNTVDMQNGGLGEYLWKKLTMKIFRDESESPVDKEKAETQWKWIEQQLSESRAEYLVVAGHYPIHSVASHGPSDCLRKRLDPLLRKYAVSAYISGHDHTLQHIVVDGLHYFVSGAGSRSESSEKHLSLFSRDAVRFKYPPAEPLWKVWKWNVLGQGGFSDGGFGDVLFNEESALLSFFDMNGEHLYETRLYPRSRN